MSAERILAHLLADGLQFLVLLQFPVLRLGPLGQFRHIIGTCDETAVVRVEPVGSIRTAPCGEYGGAILV